MTEWRVIGLGQRFAGDDAVGLVVIDALRARGVPDGVDLIALSDPMEMLPLLETATPLIVVDAVMGAERAGEVVVHAPEEFAALKLRPRSTHGLGAMEAIAMARLLWPERVAEPMWIVGVTIDAVKPGETMSSAVRDAVMRAVEVVMGLVDRATPSA